MSKRIFYASHAVGITGVVDQDDNVVANIYTGDTIEGAQSVSLNTNYNLEQIFQLGRLDIYDNYATDPEVEITINKVLDGHPLIWNRSVNADAGVLVEKVNHKPDIVLHIDEETQDAIDDIPTAAVKMTGCYLSSLNYTFPVDGNFTEELTFVSSNKTTDADGLTGPPPVSPDTRILRRQNFNLATSTLPSGVNGKCISNVTISSSLNREKMFCLGRYSPMHRYVNFPVEITVSFDTIPDGDPNSGLFPGDISDIAGPDFNENTTPECGHPVTTKEECDIRICRQNGGVDEVIYQFDFGTGCALQSVTYSGGDTGGGNVTETYTYISYNVLSIAYFG